MGLLRKKKDKENKSNRSSSKDDSLAKESSEAVEAYNNRNSSRRQASKAKMVEDEPPMKAEDVPHKEAYDNSPSSATENSSEDEGKEVAEVDTDDKKPETKGKGPWFTSRSIKLFKKPPPADQAAYSGPPRYDWVDIETHAAIKVQAAFRRMRVMRRMEEEGAHTTSAVRNYSRRRKAAQETTTNPAQDFVDLFNCCGVDLGLGGGNKEAFFDVTREMESARYSDQLQVKQDREAFVRKSYKNRPNRDSLVENVEVVQ